MPRKKIDKVLSVKVETAAPTFEELTPELLARNQERFQGFQRGLFGENHEAGTVRIRTAKINPQVDNMLRLEKEFTLNRQGKHSSEDTIKSYKKNFNRIYDFLGYNYLRQGGEQWHEARKDGLNSREIGASMPIIVLETENIASYFHDYLLNVRHLAEQTVLSAMRHFRAIVYFAQENKWIKEYPVEIHEVAPPIKPTFTTYEIEQMNRKPKTENFVEFRCYVMIKYMLATSNRIGSMLALNVEDIDFEENTITVNTQKNKKPKLMPLLPSLRKILKEYINYYRSDDDGNPLYDEPLFCNNYGQRLAYESARDAMEDYFKARGLEWKGFHKFRHSYAAFWIRDGGNPFMLKEQLGHSSLAMTNRYANLYGMATKEEAQEHSLIKKAADKAGRKAIKKRGS